MPPTYDGSFIFGVACHVVHSPEPLALQLDGFSGVNGQVSLMQGSRGRMFHITGLLLGDTPADVQVAEAVLLSYADGIARTFTDSYGTAWPNVIFTNDYQPSPEGPKPCTGGWCLPYRCSLRGLS